MAHYVERWLEQPGGQPWKFDEVHAEVEVPNLDFSGWATTAMGRWPTCS